MLLINKNLKMKILILGGLGYIGSNIAVKLCNQHEITIISKNETIPNYLEPFKNKIKIIIGNYSSETILDKTLPEIDIVIHAAGTTVPENSNLNPIYDIETNVIDTVKLLNALLKYKIKKIIFLSSGGVVYGETKDFNPIKETHILNPISSYGITKLTTEKYIQLYNKLYALDHTILRLSNIYGKNQPYKNNQGVIAHWINNAKQNKDIEIWGNKFIIRDFLYIDDLTDAISLIIDKNISGLYNVGSGEGKSLIELAKMIVEISEKNLKIIEKNMTRNFDVPYNVLNIDAFKNIAQWTPNTKLSEGLKKCLEK